MRATVTQHSIPYLYETVLMAEELGFKKISFCPNAYEDWDKEIENVLYEQWKKIGHHIKLISVEQSYIICTGVIMTIYFRQRL